jgi:hypothetical protein
LDDKKPAQNSFPLCIYLVYNRLLLLLLIEKTSTHVLVFLLFFRWVNACKLSPMFFYESLIKNIDIDICDFQNVQRLTHHRKAISYPHDNDFIYFCHREVMVYNCGTIVLIFWTLFKHPFIILLSNFVKPDEETFRELRG